MKTLEVTEHVFSEAARIALDMPAGVNELPIGETGFVLVREDSDAATARKTNVEIAKIPVKLEVRSRGPGLNGRFLICNS